MQLALFTSVLVAFLATPALAQDGMFPSLASYDASYGNSSTSFDSVACSNGPHGLENKGYRTLGDLRNFPNVGASSTVTHWNDPNCGACYTLAYGTVKVNVLVVDSCENGFVVSQQTMDTLTGNQATQLGTIGIMAVQVDASQCLR